MSFYSSKKRTMLAFTTAAAAITLSAGLLSGCSSTASGIDTAPGSSIVSEASTASSDKAIPGGTEQTSAKKDDNPGSKIYEDFKALTGKNPTTAEVLNYLEGNITKVSREVASQMVIALEAIQLKELAGIQAKINETNVQENLMKIYKPGFDLKNLEGIKDQATKKVLEEARKGGYKIETAEGMFFPVIDYSIYNSFAEAVTEDIKDYFTLMATESDKMPAKDAALVIGWDEMLQRAMAQQKFLDTWKDSPKAGDVGKLLKNYTSFTIYGLNNTPLFEYDTGRMNEKAREAYERAVQSGGEGKYFEILSDYMKKIRENDYKLTDSLKKYRDGINTDY